MSGAGESKGGDRYKPYGQQAEAETEADGAGGEGPWSDPFLLGAVAYLLAMLLLVALGRHVQALRWLIVPPWN